jgi:hypothetical protein
LVGLKVWIVVAPTPDRGSIHTKLARDFRITRSGGKEIERALLLRRQLRHVANCCASFGQAASPTDQASPRTSGRVWRGGSTNLGGVSGGVPGSKRHPGRAARPSALSTRQWSGGSGASAASAAASRRSPSG